MEDGDTEKYHFSSLIKDLVFSSRKMDYIRCISSQVYNKVDYQSASEFSLSKSAFRSQSLKK